MASATVVGYRGVLEATEIEESVAPANPCFGEVGLQLQCVVCGRQSFIAPAQLDQGVQQRPSAAAARSGRSVRALS